MKVSEGRLFEIAIVGIEALKIRYDGSDRTANLYEKRPAAEGDITFFEMLREPLGWQRSERHGGVDSTNPSLSKRIRALQTQSMSF